MDNNRLTQQKDLLKTVLEVSSILKQQRPDLDIIIRQLAEVQTVLTKDDLSSDDLKWIYEAIGYFRHFKCLYDFCPLELLDGETEQECWGRWYQILDRMGKRADLLCNGTKKKRKHK